jgi:hypothetical protein
MGMLSMRDLAYELSQPAEILANTLDDFQVAVCLLGTFQVAVCLLGTFQVAVCLLGTFQVDVYVFWTISKEAECFRWTACGRCMTGC